MTGTNRMITAGDSGWGLAWRLARREIRGSVARFRVFLGALMLGVAAIGTVRPRQLEPSILDLSHSTRAARARATAQLT